MKKLVSLLAVGALSVGFAEDDDKDYMLGKHTSEIDTLPYLLELDNYDIHLVAGDRVINWNDLAEFFENVNNHPSKYLVKDNKYTSYSKAYIYDSVHLNESACNELSKIITFGSSGGVFLYNKGKEIKIFGASTLLDIIDPVSEEQIGDQMVYQFSCSKDNVRGLSSGYYR